MAMGRIFKKSILPTCLLAVGISFGGSAYALPLAGEELVGSYTLTVRSLGKSYVFSYPEVDCIGGEIYLKNADDVIEGIYYDALRSPKNADFKIYPSKKEPFSYTGEKDGYSIDREKLKKDIKDALYARKSEVFAEKTILKPTETLVELKRRTKLLAEFSTDYSSSQKERKSNIERAVSFIGGTEVLPRQEFSFNKIVGERTAERGFKEAKIIVGGKFTEGVGGGVCQVSSTLYNAALISGLTVKERHSHSLQVSYVEPSFDAMVNSGSSDLRIYNDNDFPVYVVASADGERVTFRIYGKKSGYTYKRISEVLSYVEPPSDEVIDSAEMLYGEKKVISYSKKGVKSAGYLLKYYNGVLVEKKFLGRDTYSAVRGVVEVGTKKN